MGRTERLSKQIMRLASQIISYELNDPRIKLITVTKVKLSSDYQHCIIYVSVLGKSSQQRTAMRGLQHARGFIQKQIASRLCLRNAPQIKIEQDLSVEKSFEFHKRLEEIKKEEEKEKEKEKK